MADINAVATLGLELDASQAQASATQFGQTLADLGGKSTTAAAQVTSAGDKVTASLVQQYATLQDAQRAWEAEARAMGGSTAAMQISTAEIQRASAAWDAMLGNLKAAPVAATQAATSVAAIGTAADRSTFPLGRLRQSFASLAAQGTGTSPVIDRIVTTLGSFAIGNVWVIGILAAIAAISEGWKLLQGDAAKLAEDAKKMGETVAEAQARAAGGVAGAAVIELFGDPVKHPQGGGGVYEEQANDIKQLNELIALRTKANNIIKGGPELSIPETWQYGRLGGDKGVSNAIIAQQLQVKDDADKVAQLRKTIADAGIQHTASVAETNASEEAELIRHNAANATIRAQGIADYVAAQEKLKSLMKPGAHTIDRNTGEDVTFRQQSEAQRTVSTLHDALYPQKMVTQGYHEDDTLTRFQQQLAAFKEQADAFGKDDSIVAQMKRFSEELEHQITVLQRAGDAKSRAMIPGYQSILGQVPAVTTTLQGKVQDQYDASIDARITKLQQETAAQNALNATRSQGAEITRQVMIANAGSLAVQEAQAEADRQHGPKLAQAESDRLRQAASDKYAADHPPELTAVSNAKSLVSGIQNAQDLGVGDPAKELQDIADAYSAAIDQQMFLNDSSKDYLDLQESINLLLRERKLILDSMKASSGRYAEEGVRGAASVVNAFASPAHPESSQQRDLEGTASNAAAAITSGGSNIGADIGTVTDSLKFLVDAFNSNAANIEEQKQIERANTDAIIQMTLKLQGFIPQSVSNAASATSAIAAFEANAGAVSQLTNAQSSTGWTGRKSGDLQTQINALTPFLQASGLTYNQFMDIAKADGINLLDKNGRIVAATLVQFGAALTAATQAAFTLTQSFSDQSGIDTLIGKFKGQTTTQDQFDQQYAAFQTASGNAGPNVDPNTLAGENAIRAFGTVVAEQIKAASVPGAAPFDYSKYGNFTSAQGLINALNGLIDPLNTLTNTVNGVVDSLTNVPTGFKVAYDRYLSTFAATAAAGNPYGTVSTSPPGGVLPQRPTPQPLPGTTADVSPVTITGPVTIVSSATTPASFLKDVGVQLQSSNLRGGTSRTAYAIQQANQ